MKPALAALHSDSRTRAALRALAVRADCDSAPLDEAQPHRMLALWTGLLAGRWVLADRFETDGRRYFVLAEATTEQASSLLSAQERQLITLIAAGFTDKAMAVSLRIAPSTLSTALRRTLAKLGFLSRVELVRLLRALAVDANQ